MNIEDVEGGIHSLVNNLSEKTFIYDLLLAYGQPKSSITRLQKGDYNLSKNPGEILWKKKLFFKKETESDLHSLIDKLKSDSAIIKHHPRFIIITDFLTLLSVDTKTGDTLDVPILDMAKHFDFFLPWAGMEKSQFQSENPADIKAAERMGRLYDLIRADNSAETTDDRHSLNIFLSRLLFCFFAEDTGIFKDDQFTNAVASHTAEDGSDLQSYLQKLFKVLNLQKRHDYPRFLQDFPYVNGGLFADDYPIPKLSAKARKIIIECGALNWKAINPDIFGSMMQAVVHTDQRSSMGMHYTSVVNIIKVIEPLFLNDLYEELEKAEGEEKKLSKLLDRLYHLRIFDPACGSGNFLIIAYKELCKLEIEIFRKLQQLSNKWETAKSGLRLTQFYGIELDDFAHETAKLSLWLAEHQMNLAFMEVFGETRPTLPLQDGGHIVCGNATRVDWHHICPNNEGQVFVVGNPPYKGSRVQTSEQKEDMSYAFSGVKTYKDLDYVACWFIKVARYLVGESKAAFVATSSLCQGAQVTALWPHVFDLDLEIYFAYKSFHWANNARYKAGVTCSIIGLRKRTNKYAYLFSEGNRWKVKHINAYLIAGDDIFVHKERKPLCKVPPMLAGNYTGHAQKLMLTDEEKEQLIRNKLQAKKIIRKVMGSKELINGLSRWCIWIGDDDREFAESIPEIQDRIRYVKKAREGSRDKEANKLALRPHQFRDMNETKHQSIVVPTVSSERRDYLPVAFIDKNTIVTNKAMVLYDCEAYIFGFLVSRIHMVWVRAIAGRMRKDISYSSVLCYNTFPFPNITETQRTTLEDHVFKVLDERERHPEKTLAELYDPDKMPEDLRQAHNEMDLAVEQCYRSRPFKDDEERLEYLFNLYSEKIEAEKREGE